MPRNPFISRSYQWNRPRKHDNPETRLVRQILLYLRAKNLPCGKLKNMGVVRDGRYCADPLLFLGLPDILVFTPTLMFIEAKANKSSLQSDYQKTFQSCCEKANIPYILARDLSDAMEAVK